jgi:hypothetical protein
MSTRISARGQGDVRAGTRRKDGGRDSDWPAHWRIIGWILLSIAFLFSFNVLGYYPLTIRSVTPSDQMAVNRAAANGFAAEPPR